jgi:NAD(P)-dependent dehydrogenase (short-subunit alcohol dehydrogenase family)
LGSKVAKVDGVTCLSEGRIDAIVANAGGEPPETSLTLNFFGAVTTLEGLRPLLKASSAPRAVAVSSVAALQSPVSTLVEACLNMDEAAAVAAGRFGHAVVQCNDNCFQLLSCNGGRAPTDSPTVVDARR